MMVMGCATAYAQKDATLTDTQIIDILNSNFPEDAHPEHEFSHLTYIYKDKSFVVGTGGCVIATATTDFGHVMENPNEFKTIEIPMQIQRGDNCISKISAQQTHLYLNAVAMPGQADEIGAFVKVYLLGDNYSPQLEYAQLTYRGVTAGLGYTLFADLGAMIPTIDFQGPTAYAAVGNTVINYRHNISEKIELGVGMETPILSGTYTNLTYQVSQRVPDIPIEMKYAFCDDSWMRFSAILRNMYYRDVIIDSTKDALGWGAMLSGKWQWSSNANVVWQGTYGKGITSYYQDYTDCGMDLMPDESIPGMMKTVESWGGYVGLEYDFSDKVIASAAYSQVRAFPSYYSGGETPWSDQCRYTQNVIGNIMWNISDYFTLGAEYIYGRRVNMDGAQAHDNRIQAMARFAF